MERHCVLLRKPLTASILWFSKFGIDFVSFLRRYDSHSQHGRNGASRLELRPDH